LGHVWVQVVQDHQHNGRRLLAASRHRVHRRCLNQGQFSLTVNVH
jgi:hypothetical protein